MKDVLLPAALTYQKLDWFDSIFGPMGPIDPHCPATTPRSGYLPVTSVVPQATIFSGDPPGGKDGNPASIEFVFANDPDGDGILTPNDLCPFVANTLDQNIDSDCDGIGDPCDKCPHDPLNDADHDGVCGDVDNCPNVPNSDQANCNLDSEIATHTAVLGDACDPVPCPNMTAPIRTSVQRACTNGIIISICDTQNFRDTLFVDPVGSHSANSGVGTPPPGSPEITIPNVPTSYRFCQRVPFVHTCTGAEIDESLLNAAASAALETQQQPWHRVTIDNFSSTGVRGVGENFDYPDPLGAFGLIQRPWEYTNDYNFWRANNIVQLDPPGVYGQTSLDGRMWSHGDTTAGAFTQPAPGYGTHGPQLVNHYFDLAPDAVSRKVTIKQITFVNPLAILWPLCPACVPGTWWEFGAPETLLITPAAGEWAALRSGTTGVAITAAIGPALLSSLNDPTVTWVNAAEPSINIGRSDVPISVGLTDAGRHVVDDILPVQTTAGLSLLGQIDRGQILITEIGSPPVRENFSEVFSRAADMLFLVGGRNPTTHEELGDLWYRPRSLDGWTQLSMPGFQLNQVLASTFSFADGKLYVLDHAIVAGQDVARLLAIDVAGRRFQVVTSWNRRGPVDHQWLVVDHDGGILLFNSSTTNHHFAMYRLHLTGDHVGHDDGEQLDDGMPNAFGELLRRGNRDILLQPVADEFGYTLALRQSVHAANVLTQRFALTRDGKKVVCKGDCDDEDDDRGSRRR